MKRFVQAVGSALLLAATALHAGCGGGGITTSAVQAADVPQGLTNADPMARPVAVAWTSARAKRCGFYFDPAKLKINYLSYERTQGATPEQLANLEKAFDSAYYSGVPRYGDRSALPHRRFRMFYCDTKRKRGLCFAMKVKVVKGLRRGWFRTVPVNLSSVSCVGTTSASPSARESAESDLRAATRSVGATADG